MQNTVFEQQGQQTAAYAPPAERMAFLRKIYALLSLSIFVAAGVAFTVTTDEAMFSMVTNNYILFIVLEIVAIIVCFAAKKKQNLALFALFAFTALTGATISPVLMRYTGGTITQAASLTGIIFVGLSMYTINSKKDFSFMGGMLVTVLLVVIVGSLMNVFIFQSSLMSFGISSVAVILFSGFIVYDTSNIIRHYPTDEYISATLALYLDILNLFLHLLRLLGSDD